MYEQNKTTTTAKFTELEKKQEAELQGVYTMLAEAKLAESATKNHLELFLYRVEQMMAAQQDYFRSNTQTHLKAAKALEDKVKKANQALRRLGYNPDRFNQLNNTQKNIFNDGR